MFMISLFFECLFSSEQPRQGIRRSRSAETACACSQAESLRSSQGSCEEMDPSDAWYYLGENAFNNQEYEEAVKYWQEASELGNAEAVCCLAWCYENNCGAEPDERRAEHWKNKVKAEGIGDAKEQELLEPEQYALIRFDRVAYFLSSSLRKHKEELAFYRQHQYVAPHLVETERLYLKRVRSAQQEWEGYQAIFNDYPETSGWPTDYITKDVKEQEVSRKHDLGYYQLVLGFSDYMIHLRENNAIVGKLGLGNDKGDGRIETVIYILSGHRGKGYGPEALSVFCRNIVMPGMRKPYFFIPRKPIEHPQKNESAQEFCARVYVRFKPVVAPQFLGVHANCDLANCRRNNDYGSIATHHKAGYGITLDGGKVIMTYPVVADQTLTKEGVDVLVDISRIFRECLSIQVAHRERFLFLDSTHYLSIRDILKNPDIFGLSRIQKLKSCYEKLLEIGDPKTFLSAYNYLMGDFKMTQGDIMPLISPEKRRILRI